MSEPTLIHLTVAFLYGWAAACSVYALVIQFL
jgi:hypothetical protein